MNTLRGMRLSISIMYKLDLSMITFSIRSLSTILVGLLLVFMSESVLPLMVRVIGAAFSIPALVSIIVAYRNRHRTNPLQTALISVVDIGSIAFGLWLLVAPGAFLSMLLMLLSFALLVTSFYQLFMLFVSRKYFPLSWKTMLTPFLLVLLAIIVFANPFDAVYFSSVLLGTGLFIAGLSDFILSFRIYRSMPHDAIELSDK